MRDVDYSKEFSALMGQIRALHVRTFKTEQRILERAIARDEAVVRELSELRQRASVDTEATQKYQELVLERDQLARIIALARKNLADWGEKHGLQ